MINAAFTCYENYHKYQFPNWKLGVGNSEIILIPEFPVWAGHEL